MALPATTAGAAPTHDAGAGGIERTDAPAPGEGFVALTPTRILDTRDGLGRPGTSPVPQGGVVSLQVTGVAGVPAEGVDAVVVNVTGTQGTEDGNYVTVYPAGAERPTASNLNLDAGQTRPNLVVVKVGAEGRVDLFNFKGNLHLVADVAGYFPTGSDFTGMSPERILDTRKGLGRIGIDPVVQSETVDLQVAGVGGVPATGVTAVAMNVTATNVTEDGGYVTAYPAGAERPVASNLNLDAGQTRPNLVVVKVGTAGMVSLFNFKGRTDLIVDVAGYFTGDDVFVGTVPERILDTRAGIGRPGTDPLRQDESLRLQVSGVAGVPAADEVAAVVVNITAVRPSLDGGYVTAWPTRRRPAGGVEPELRRRRDRPEPRRGQGRRRRRHQPVQLQGRHAPARRPDGLAARPRLSHRTVAATGEAASRAIPRSCWTSRTRSMSPEGSAATTWTSRPASG